MLIKVKCLSLYKFICQSLFSICSHAQNVL